MAVEAVLRFRKIQETEDKDRGAMAHMCSGTRFRCDGACVCVCVCATACGRDFHA